MGFTNMLHPTFEALSAHADRGELEAAGTRVARHVSRCPDCQETVREILSLGQRARAEVGGGEPHETLWPRIEGAARQLAEEEGKPREKPASEPIPWEVAPSLRPTRHWPVPITRRAARVATGFAIAVAAGIAGVLAWPQGNALQASGVSRLTFSPVRPAPGGMVTVRYLPAPWLRGAPRLLLIGRLQPSAEPRATEWWMRALADSLATLRPAKDGYFVGRFRLPSSAQVVELAVTDSAGGDVDTDGRAPWRLIVGDAGGGPSFSALLLAAETSEPVRGLPESSRPRQPFNPADSLRRFFPAHPAGHAYSEDYGKQKGVFTLLNFFQTAERKYLALWQELWPQKQLDGDAIHAMVVFARRIDEPDEEIRWAHRLVREHPGHPRALDALARALHNVELRQPPGLADSIRSWFPVLDSLYRRTPVPIGDVYAFRQLLYRYADSATKAVWEERFDAASGPRAHVTRYYVNSQLRRLPASSVRDIEEAAATECRLPVGRYPLSLTADAWRRECAGSRGMAYGLVARWRLLHGDPRGALTMADSAGRQIVLYNGCSWSGPHLTSASAWLALGDTLLAENELASMFRDELRPNGGWADSVRAMLGSRFDQERFDAKVAANGAKARLCYEEKRKADRARLARLEARSR